MLSSFITRLRASAPKLALAGLLAVGLGFPGSQAQATPVVDYSGLPANTADGGFGLGGVQFLNTTEFVLGTVEIAFALTTPGTATFQVWEFDGGVGDTTGQLIGSLGGQSLPGIPVSSFADAVLFDLTSLALRLSANTVYGFTLADASGLLPPGDLSGARAASTGSIDTDPTIGTIYNGTVAPGGVGTFVTLSSYEIPFIASSAVASVPLPAGLPLLAIVFAGLGLARRRKAS